MDRWLIRLMLLTAWGSLAWLALERFVPPHPVEQSPALLPLAGALAFALTAHGVSAVWLQRLLRASAIALVILALAVR